MYDTSFIQFFKNRNHVSNAQMFYYTFTLIINMNIVVLSVKETVTANLDILHNPIMMPIS